MHEMERVPYSAAIVFRNQRKRLVCIFLRSHDSSNNSRLYLSAMFVIVVSDQPVLSRDSPDGSRPEWKLPQLGVFDKAEPWRNAPQRCMMTV